MAKVIDVFLNGTIGNVVFYRGLATNCARSEALDSGIEKNQAVNEEIL